MELNELTQQTIQRYSDRYNKLGYDVKTLGWGSKDQQEYRFSQVISSELQLEGKEILDIGCGFGDFYKFILPFKLQIKNYIGYDINPDLINEAKKIYDNSPDAKFEVKNVFDIDSKEIPIADIGFMFGLLNLNWKEKYDNLEYSKQAIKKAFTLVREVLVIDFLSAVKSPDYPSEDYIYYHDPSVMLNFALTISPNVVLKHNYRPIPQKEFMLIIYK